MEKQKAILHIDSYSSKYGQLLLSVQDNGVKAMLRDLIELCEKKHGGYIKVEMSPPYRQRTLAMNDKWWAMCTEYGRFIGDTKKNVALGVKYRAMEEGLWEGVEVPFTNGVKVPMSTAVADVRQMSILIDVLYRIAAESGYEFSDL